VQVSYQTNHALKNVVALTGETQEGYYQPLEKAELVREGGDVTILCYSRMRYVVMQAVQSLEKQGFDPEVIPHTAACIILLLASYCCLHHTALELNVRSVVATSLCCRRTCMSMKDVFHALIACQGCKLSISNLILNWSHPVPLSAVHVLVLH